MRRLAATLLLALSGVEGLLTACGSPPVTLTPEDERALRPVPDMSPEVRRLVDRGDALFIGALPPHRKGETMAALDLYMKARASYLEAQTHYASLTPVPAPLLDRVRECVTRIAVLQRQRHAAAQ